MANLSEKDKQLIDLYEKCVGELKTGGHEATDKLLNHLGIQNEIKNEEIYKRIQLMFAQERYTNNARDIVGRVPDDALAYKLEEFKSDYQAFTNQLIDEFKRPHVSPQVLMRDVNEYNSVAKNANYKDFQLGNPKNNDAQKVNTGKLTKFLYSTPDLMHFTSGDFESLDLDKNSHENYIPRVNNYFNGVLQHSVLGTSTPVINITPEQACNIRIKNEPQQNNNVTTHKPKEGSQLAKFLEKFAEKSIEVKQAILGQDKNICGPEHVGSIQEGMTIVLPENCIDTFTGNELPELEVEVLDAWQKGGQMMISTSAGIVTTRDLSLDIHIAMQDRINEMELTIEQPLQWAQEVEEKTPEIGEDVGLEEIGEDIGPDLS